jgi:hypothetical protein
MTLETASDGSIHVRDRFVFLRAGLLVASALFLGMAAMQRLYALDQVRAVWASLGLALGCAALAGAIEDSAFQFDAVRREVRWSKRRLVGGRSGTIPFAEVENLVLEMRSSRSDSGLSRTDDYRVFLVARSITMPLGSSNLDLSRARDAVAIPLLALLGKSNRALVEDSIRYWVSRHDRITASALAVGALHLDSKAAARLIEEMASSLSMEGRELQRRD